MKAEKMHKSDLRDIMRRGDLKSLKKIFKQMKLSDQNDRHVNILSWERELLVDILSIASVQAESRTLKKEVAWTIINHVSPNLNIFSLLYNLTFYERRDCEYLIDKNVIVALECDEPSDDVFGRIEAMSDCQIFALINFITKKINSLNTKFCQPIIRRLYGEKVIPSSLLFGLMAVHLEEAADRSDPLLMLYATTIAQNHINEPDDDDDENEEGEDDEDGAF